jgi:hypothetical protein
LDAFESKSALCESSRVKRPGTGSGRYPRLPPDARGKVVDIGLRRYDGGGGGGAIANDSVIP